MIAELEITEREPTLLGKKKRYSPRPEVKMRDQPSELRPSTYGRNKTSNTTALHHPTITQVHPALSLPMILRSVLQ